MLHTKSMYITNVETEGPFLKIWGQTDKNSALEVEEALLRASKRFNEGNCEFLPTSLEVGVLCCAKYVDEKYYRARITSIALFTEGMVEVNFIDFGNKDVIPISHLRSLECFNPSFISLQPLSTPFILAEVVCVGGEWNDDKIDQISKEIRYIETNYAIIAQAIRYYFIKLFVRDIDLGLHLVRQNLMQKTSVQTQEAVLLAMIPRPTKSTPSSNQSLLQYKSVTLEPNSQHEVYVSYITDGPCHFSVQLKKYESTLTQLMREINSIPLKPFEELPIPGTVCLAKCVEDSHICRAVVTSEVDSQYKIFYVDFGNSELVPPENLYQMGFKYVIPNIMAIRLSLAGIEKPSMTLEMQCAFKQFVDNRLLMMEVLPAAKKLALPKCRMWDPDTNTDVIEVLSRAAKCAYPDPVPLHKGFTQAVKVSFVYSCNRFYVQLKNKESELNQLMVDLQAYCNSNQTSYLDKAKVGQPCCALFSFDQQWYRTLITELIGNAAKIRYIDYGNEEEVPVNTLKVIEGEYLTVLRPQAIECCLNGYQNMTEDPERDLKLEELILEQEFSMRVIDSMNTKMLVDLMDSNNTTVTALLLQSIIAQTKVRTTPIIETRPEIHEKRHSPGEKRDTRNDKPYFQHDDRRSPSNRNWKDKTDETPWRQNGRTRCDSNESTESWRQDNRGFRNRKENDWNERPNDNFKNDRGGFRGRNNNSESDRSERPPRSRNQEDGWGNKEDQNKPSRNQNERRGPREDNRSQNKPRNRDDDWNASNSKSDSFNNESQGFKKKTDNENIGNDSYKDFKSRNKPENDWNNQNSTGGSGGDWGDKKGYRDKSNEGDNWASNKGNSERKFGDRSRDDRGSFTKKAFRREGSESSGSEKNVGKGPRTSSRNDSRPPRTDRKFVNKSPDNSWNVSAVPSVIDSAPNDATFKTIDVTGRQEKIAISWFHNPISFFCQLIESQASFRTLMQDIQEAYKNRPAASCVKGAPAVALFPEDNVLYRARILEVIGNQYKVHYVDFGNVSIVDKVWPIENKFMEMPMQAIPCALSGIQPVGDNWPNPDNFSSYFEKEQLDCNFLASENERWWINISSENVDVSQQLVNNGLAKYCDLPVIPFEILLLVEKQFRAMVKCVNNPLDFSLLLQSGISLNCSMHNLSSATEVNEDVLQDQLEKIVIVYADDLVEDRLEVTLYDSTGNKLNIVAPDEGAFDTVEALCPYLVTTSTIQGFVSHVNETSIVIQPSECSQNISYLVEQMYEYYENMPPDNPLIPEEEFIYAAKSTDGNWYRSRVIAFDDDKATVVYLDYGNSEEVEFSNLRELTSDFMQFDIMAILVDIKVPASDFLEQEVTGVIYYGEAGWEGEVQIISGTDQLLATETPVEVIDSNELPAQPVELLEEPVDLPSHSLEPSQEVIQPEGAIEPSVEYTEVSTEPLSEPDEISSIRSPKNTDINKVCEEPVSSGIESDYFNSNGTSVVLSHIDSPSDFYIQLVDSLGAIDDLQLKLQEEAESLALLETGSVGGLCAAPYSLDQHWYRSQILDADDDITTVRFIDYGNTDVIDNKTTQIKTLSADLLSLEEYSTRCRLKIKPIEEEWSVPANTRFEELTSVENIRVEFIDQDEKTNYVELYSNGENVKDILIQENLAVLDDVLIEGKLTGFVSHTNSPSEFWVQLESCCVELEWIAEQLSNAVSFPDLEDLTPGSLCAAMFPDDEMWYRARILSNTVAGLEVLFVDYGNSCICSNLKQLPEDLVMAPPLAQKCSLQKPEGLLHWSSEAAEKFMKLSAEGQTIFTVKKLTTGETSIVELLVDGEDVSGKLLPNTDNGYVTDIDSTECFSVSKEGVSTEEKYKLEKIPGADYNEECNEKFKEISNAGKTRFDVEYLSENTVRLYWDGNDIRNELKDIVLKRKTIVPEEHSPSNTSQKGNQSHVQDHSCNSFEDPPNTSHENSTEIVEAIITRIISNASSNAALNWEQEVSIAIENSLVQEEFVGNNMAKTQNAADVEYSDSVTEESTRENPQNDLDLDEPKGNQDLEIQHENYSFEVKSVTEESTIENKENELDSVESPGKQDLEVPQENESFEGELVTEESTVESRQNDFDADELTGKQNTEVPHEHESFEVESVSTSEYKQTDLDADEPNEKQDLEVPQENEPSDIELVTEESTRENNQIDLDPYESQGKQDLEVQENESFEVESTSQYKQTDLDEDESNEEQDLEVQQKNEPSEVELVTEESRRENDENDLDADELRGKHDLEVQENESFEIELETEESAREYKETDLDAEEPNEKQDLEVQENEPSEVELVTEESTRENVQNDLDADESQGKQYLEVHDGNNSFEVKTRSPEKTVSYETENTESTSKSISTETTYTNESQVVDSEVSISQMTVTEFEGMENGIEREAKLQYVLRGISDIEHKISEITTKIKDFKSEKDDVIDENTISKLDIPSETQLAESEVDQLKQVIDEDTVSALNIPSEERLTEVENEEITKCDQIEIEVNKKSIQDLNIPEHEISEIITEIDGVIDDNILHKKNEVSESQLPTTELADQKQKRANLISKSDSPSTSPKIASSKRHRKTKGKPRPHVISESDNKRELPSQTQEDEFEIDNLKNVTLQITRSDLEEHDSFKMEVQNSEKDEDSNQIASKLSDVTIELSDKLDTVKEYCKTKENIQNEQIAPEETQKSSQEDIYVYPELGKIDNPVERIPKLENQEEISSGDNSQVKEDTETETDCLTCDVSQECSSSGSQNLRDDKNTSKFEFHEKILESFPAPTVSTSLEVTTKFSPTKVVPKIQKDLEDEK